MRQDALRCLAALAGLSALACPGRANAAVLWTATFESGTLSEWMPGVNPTKGTRKNVEVLGEQVYGGKFAGKITCHPDDTFTFGQNRVDIQHQSTLTAQNEQIWLSGHYMMPEDAKVRNDFAFFESNSSFLNAMDFWVEPKMGGATGTNIVFGVGDLGRTVVWTGDFKVGVWHQVAIHVLWSTNAAVGTVDVWFDGVQVVTDRKAQTSRDTNTLFFQTGLHRRAVANFTETIYLDDFIEADNFADAKIAPPMGSDGGVATDSGGGAGGGGAGGAADAGGRMDAGTAAGGAGGAGGATAAGTGGATSVGAGGATSVGVGGATGSGAGTGGTTGVGTGGTSSGATGGSSSGPATTGAAGNATSSGTGAGGTSGAAPADTTAGCSCTILGAGEGALNWRTAAGLIVGAAMLARRRRRSR